MVKSFLQRRSGLVLKPEQGRGLVAEQSLTGPSPHTFGQSRPKLPRLLFELPLDFECISVGRAQG
jgi:hypothetical protein